MEMKDFSLEGKVALVTGASYGIGFAIAEGMAKAGATIVFNDIRQELVDKGLAAYKEAGVEAHGYVCDVTDEDAVQAMVKQIAQEVGVIDAARVPSARLCHVGPAAAAAADLLGDGLDDGPGAEASKARRRVVSVGVIQHRDSL